MNSHADNVKVPEAHPADKRREESLTKALEEEAAMKFPEPNLQSGKLLFLLNAMRNSKVEKIESLNQKNNICDDKITRLKQKLERLDNKAERLSMANAALQEFFKGSVPKPLRVMAEKNIKRIEKIRQEKIPNESRKILGLNEKKARNTRKINVLQCTVDKVESLDKLIRSFSILNRSERRKEFTQALDCLHEASCRSLKLKIQKCNDKIPVLLNKYELASTSEKFAIADKIEAQKKKREVYNIKLKKLSSIEKPFAMQPDNAVDSVIEQTQKKVSDYEKSIDTFGEVSGSFSISDFAEDIHSGCVSGFHEQQKENEVQQDSDTLNKLMENISKNTEVSTEGKRSLQSKKPKQTDRSTDFKQEIFGNADYNSIENKFYAPLTPERAKEVSAILTANNIRHSGKIYSRTDAKITLDKSDLRLYRQLTSKQQEKVRDNQKQAPAQSKGQEKNKAESAPSIMEVLKKARQEDKQEEPKQTQPKKKKGMEL